MKLQTPPAEYNRMSEIERNRQIELADQQNVKQGRDVVMRGARVILYSPDGTAYALTVANNGTLGTAAV